MILICRVRWAFGRPHNHELTQRNGLPEIQRTLRFFPVGFFLQEIRDFNDRQRLCLRPPYLEFLWMDEQFLFVHRMVGNQ